MQIILIIQKFRVPLTAAKKNSYMLGGTKISTRFLFSKLFPAESKQTLLEEQQMTWLTLNVACSSPVFFVIQINELLKNVMKTALICILLIVKKHFEIYTYYLLILIMY